MTHEDLLTDIKWYIRINLNYYKKMLTQDLESDLFATAGEDHARVKLLEEIMNYIEEKEHDI